MARFLFLGLLGLIICVGCGTANAPIAEKQKQDLQEPTGQEESNDEAFVLKERTAMSKVVPESVEPFAQFVSDLGALCLTGLAKELENTVLEQYEVPVNEANFSEIKKAMALFDSQFVYAEKLLFKEFLLEFYELKDEILDSNYSDRYPSETRKLSAKFFRESDDSLKQAHVAINAYIVRHLLERRFKEAYLSGESMSLFEINIAYNACAHLREAIRFFEQRQDTVHEFLKANKEFQLEQGKPVAPFFIEEHAYWSMEDYSAKPDIGDHFYKPVMPPIDKTKWRREETVVVKALEFPCVTGMKEIVKGSNDDITYLRTKFPNDIEEGMIPRGTRPYWDEGRNEPKALPPAASKIASAAFINSKILDWVFKRKESDSRHRVVNSMNGRFNSKLTQTGVKLWIQKIHVQTYGFLSRENGLLLKDSTFSEGEYGEIVAFPDSAKLLMHELVSQAPAPKKSDYSPEFDETIQFFEDWIANKGAR